MKINGELGSVKAQVSMSIQTQAQDTSSKLVSDLMSKTLNGTSAANQNRASQGIGTNLNITA